MYFKALYGLLINAYCRGEDDFFVVDDNARTPSGVSDMLENRETMMGMFPELFMRVGVESVASYPRRLAKSLAACAPDGAPDKPVVAVLTPGIYNSAYFEHAFLADNMGVELVEGSDLRVQNGKISMRTTRGYRPVDVIYRRIDDNFLDPECFRPDSMLGVPGVMDVYRAGGITLANAPGTGIADDKSIYPYVPKMIEFYLGEKPILQNVPTHICRDKADLQQENRDLRNNVQQRWFMIGAGVVLGSLLLGWLLPLLRFRRRSRSTWSDI